MSQEAPHHHPPPFDVPSVEEMTALLPQYAFEKLAAYGGMGAVFKARQESLDRPVAIKILPPEFGAEKDFAERFKAEARAMAKLNHTHIVAVYDFGITTAGHLYLVMEWVEGHSLHEIIHKGVLPVRRAAAMAMQLCDALTFAHNHKILHRDIKPGNIMVNEDDQVKVADFGLARPITGEAEENPFGTPDYAAPEIINGGKVDQRVDIYAAGVVLYEMLTGHVPKNPRRSVTEYAPASPRWDTLIDKATHADPEQRFQSALELRAHIKQTMSGSADAVAVVEVVEKENEPNDGAALRRTYMIIVAAVAAIIVIAAVLGMLFNSEPVQEHKAQETPAITQNQTESPEVKPETPEPETEKKTVKPEVVVMPAPETEKKPVEAETPTKNMTVATPAPAPPPTMPPVPAPETPLEAIQKLEERDPELAQLVNAFRDEWTANEEIHVESAIQELAGKYIPALQRSLSGITPEQRDPILSEISHIANREPLNEPELSWPPALINLRKTYAAQHEAIQSKADDAARKMRAAQCELVLAKAKERAGAGKIEAAKRAEVVAAELADLQTAPSMKALQQSAASAGAVRRPGPRPMRGPAK